jgi:hypothetical protein
MKTASPDQKKTCIECGEEKDLDQFELRKDTQKYRNNCIACNKASAKKRYHGRYIRTRPVGPTKSKLEYNKDYYAENNYYVKEQQKDYRAKNKIKIRLYNNELEKEKRKSDPSFRLRKDISRTILAALKENDGSKHNRSVMDYLIYSIDELKEHLEKQFEPWMTWNNHGVYLADCYVDDDPSTWTWHIDHIVPQSKLPYASMEEENFQKCWALPNLRPLKSIDNMKKSNK